MFGEKAERLVYVIMVHTCWAVACYIYQHCPETTHSLGELSIYFEEIMMV